ncbi:MAG: hypothetical protein AVDCRST_MAG49-394, partial [uncultured Thermomicrobiales bacterium]
ARPAADPGARRRPRQALQPDSARPLPGRDGPLRHADGLVRPQRAVGAPAVRRRGRGPRPSAPDPGLHRGHRRPVVAGGSAPRLRRFLPGRARLRPDEAGAVGLAGRLPEGARPGDRAPGRARLRGLRGDPAPAERLVAGARRRHRPAGGGGEHPGAGADRAALQPVRATARRGPGHAGEGARRQGRRADRRRLPDGHEPADREGERVLHGARHYQADRARRHADLALRPGRDRRRRRPRARPPGPRRYLALRRPRRRDGLRRCLGDVPPHAAAGQADGHADRRAGAGRRRQPADPLPGRNGRRVRRRADLGRVQPGGRAANRPLRDGVDRPGTGLRGGDGPARRPEPGRPGPSPPGDLLPWQPPADRRADRRRGGVRPPARRVGGL